MITLRRILAALLFALPAFAQDAALPAAFQAYLDSPAYASRLSDLVAMAKKSHFPSCDALTTGPAAYKVLKPVRMGEDGVPKGGMWKASLLVQGCGKARIINAFFFVGKGHKVFFAQAIPGTTKGDFRLQSDTVRYVLMAASVHNKDCKTNAITNSRFERLEPANDTAKTGAALLGVQLAGRQWREAWTVASCGRFFEVSVRYLTDTTGTTINASSKDVVEISPEDAAKATPGG